LLRFLHNTPQSNLLFDCQPRLMWNLVQPYGSMGTPQFNGRTIGAKKTPRQHHCEARTERQCHTSSCTPSCGILFLNYPQRNCQYFLWQASRTGVTGSSQEKNLDLSSSSPSQPN